MPTTIAEMTAEVVNILTATGVNGLVGVVAGFGAIIAGAGYFVRRISKAFR